VASLGNSSSPQYQVALSNAVSELTAAGLTGLLASDLDITVNATTTNSSASNFTVSGQVGMPGGAVGFRGCSAEL
jgi:hypothetical protein